MAGNQVQAGGATIAHRGVALSRLSAVPEVLWMPAVVGLLIGVIGAAGLLVHQPLLFASLGPTAYLIAHSPHHPSARWYNTVVGHLIGLIAACAIVALFGATDAPSVFVTHHLVGIRVMASASALALAIAGESLLGASHPPAAATVLLITLGGFSPSLHSALVIMTGVLMLSLIGIPLRRLRGAMMPSTPGDA